MRVSGFRPSFDHLDARIVLTDPGLIGGVVPVPSTVGTPSLPGDNINIVPTTGWFQGGTPPSSTVNPMDPEIPISFQTATTFAAT